MSNDQEAFLSGGGAPSAKFANHGDTVKGIVVSAEMRQQTDPKDNSPKTWDDGNPMMQLVVTLQTDERDSDIEDDEGIRRVFVKGKMRTAVIDALKKVGAKTVEPGGTLVVKYTGDGEKTNPAFSPPKLYEAAYKAPEPVAAGSVSVDELL